jgi:hypothetical protein
MGTSMEDGNKSSEHWRNRIASMDTNAASLATDAQPAPSDLGMIETTVSPFHCLYNDALHFHTESRLRDHESRAEGSRYARAALSLYLDSASALVHQAAVELGRPELWPLVADPSRPLPLSEVWRLLPSIVGEGPAGSYRPDQAPWPQFTELLALRISWIYPGPPNQRKAYYKRSNLDGSFEVLAPHESQSLGGPRAEQLVWPKTGLPRDPYALRPHHLDTARKVLDSAIEALDRRLYGALTRDNRHRVEPVRRLEPPKVGN